MNSKQFPVQLLSFSEKGNFSLNESSVEILKRIPNDHKLVVVSIAGAFRKGKSFALSFFLRYLNFMYNESSENAASTWLGEERTPLKGFTWKCGQDRVTTGIQMWSKIFCTTVPNLGKVAIIVLDTQGLFDDRTTTAANAKVFALSTMLSSTQILNLSQHIQEDNLQLLKFFTDYGSLAASANDQTIETPFQKLMILIRDWSYPHETPYGHEGGRQLTEKVLEVKDDQHEELRSVRERIKSCFTNIEGFLMPHPGLKVATNPNFDGRLSEIDEEFKKSLKELVPLLFSTENLIPKRINGREITAKELVTYIKHYVEKLNGDEIPTPKGIMDANAEVSHKLAFDTAVQKYKNSLDAVCGNSRPYVPPEELSKKEKECYDNAVKHFEKYPKFGSNELTVSYRNRFKGEFSTIYQSFVTDNERKKQIADLEQNTKANEMKLDNLNDSLQMYKNENQKSTRKVDELNRQIDVLNSRISSMSLQAQCMPSWQPNYSYSAPRRSSSSSSSFYSSASDNSFQCDICGRCISSRIGMWSHKAKHARDGDM